MNCLGILMKEPQGKDILPDDLAWHKFLVRYPTLLNFQLFAFTLRGIDYHKKVIHGYRYSLETERWEKERLFKLPDVILNRSYTPHLTDNKLWELKRNRLFNSHLWLSKSKMHKTLQKHQILRKHLPPTLLTLNSDNLAQSLDKCDSVFLKPIMRAQGRGIFQVTRVYKHVYNVTFMKDHKVYRMVVSGFSDLLDQLKNCLYKDKYIIQRDINLATLEQRKFDFRIFAIRKADGTWSVPGSYGRWAKRHAILTNQSQGAETVDTRWLLGKCFRQNATPMYSQIERLAILASKEVSNQYDHIALLGHDFGVDLQGHIWFLEANAYPGFPEETATYDVVKAIFNYSKSLYV